MPAGRKPGTPKTGGRKKGTPNKDRKQVLERVEALGCDLVQSLVRVGQEAESVGELAIARQAYSDLMGYCFPKLRQVDHTIGNDAGQVFEVNMLGFMPGADNSSDLSDVIELPTAHYPSEPEPEPEQPAEPSSQTIAEDQASQLERIKAALND